MSILKISAYDRVKIARDAKRPGVVDYIDKLFTDFIELKGDRLGKEDASILGGVAMFHGMPVTVIGHRKGKNLEENMAFNFGMPGPEGYRKALRAAKLAEKFNIPILMLVDTPGAYPGLGAEERNQSEAIARNLLEFAELNVPTVSVVIGEGGSGGALALGVADRFAMMRYSVFSVISPEGCSAILWNDPKKVEDATNAMKITSADLKALGLIDAIVNEPLIGAHRAKDAAAQAIKEYFLSELQQLQTMSSEQRMQERYAKLIAPGAFSE